MARDDDVEQVGDCLEGLGAARAPTLPPLMTPPEPFGGEVEALKLRKLGFGVGEADAMLLDLERLSSSDRWLLVLDLAVRGVEREESDHSPQDGGRPERLPPAPGRPPGTRSEP